MGFKRDEIIDEFSKLIKKNYPDSKIILFGSRARGDNLKDSDYDFVIISNNFKSLKTPKRLELVYDLWPDYKYNADILPYTQEEFNVQSKMLTITKKAKEEGIII